MKIALLGTGLMGYPMAERLLKANEELTVYNRTLKKAKPLKDLGAKVAKSSQEAVQNADGIILMLSDATAIRDVLPLKEPESLAGKTVIQMGTIAPGESIEFNQQIRAQGGEYFECPVLGSIKEAREGQLILMVGAEPKQFSRWESFLKCFGPRPKLIGEVGKAAALKLALNQLIASLASTFSLSLSLIQRQGVDVDEFMSILSGSALYAPAFTRKLPRFLERDFSNPNFPVKHMLKDVELFLRVAEGQGLSTEALQGVRDILKRTVEQGYGDEDYSALFNVISPR